MRTDTAEESDYLPVQTLTEGPKGHWFSYYDKFQTDERSLSDDEWDLTAEAKPEDVIKVGMIDYTIK